MEAIEFPIDLLDKIVGEKPAVQKFDLPSQILNGQRNDFLFKYACKLRSSGLTQEEIFAATDSVNKSRCSSPISSEELSVLVESACKYSKGTKRKINPMWEIAEDVKSGLLGKPYVYCIENDNYYVYEDNYWKSLREIELERTITEQIPVINTYALSQKKQVTGHLRVVLQKRMDCFNSTNLLNFPEGEFDPIAMKLDEHNQEHYSTIRLPYSYNER